MSECIPGHQKYVFRAANSLSRPQWPRLSWVSIISRGRVMSGGTSTHRSSSVVVFGMVAKSILVVAVAVAVAAAAVVVLVVFHLAQRGRPTN